MRSSSSHWTASKLLSRVSDQIRTVALGLVILISAKKPSFFFTLLYFYMLYVCFFSQICWLYLKINYHHLKNNSPTTYTCLSLWISWNFDGQKTAELLKIGICSVAKKTAAPGKLWSVRWRDIPPWKNGICWANKYKLSRWLLLALVVPFLEYSEYYFFWKNCIEITNVSLTVYVDLRNRQNSYLIEGLHSHCEVWNKTFHCLKFYLQRFSKYQWYIS